MGYDLNGKPVGPHGFRHLIKYTFYRDSVTGALYSTLYVPQTNEYGEKQYPFVIWPNYPNGGNESALEMNKRLKFLCAINGSGCLNPYGEGVTVSGLPYGAIIQNNVLLREDAEHPAYFLTVDQNGNLGHLKRIVPQSQIVEMGIVSACDGYGPMLIDYQDAETVDSAYSYLFDSNRTPPPLLFQDAQRQAICQYGNGDYLIITSEGRHHCGGGFFTILDMRRICRQHGVKFAYMLDGGGSAETVVGNKQINTIYENQYGRRIPTFIVFNGTTTFKSSNA